MSDSLLRLNEVMRRTGLRKTSIYDRVARGTFPRFRKVGVATVWSEKEISQWIEGVLADNEPHEEARR